MFLKIHHSPGKGDVVAVCDRELLNRTLRHGEIEVFVSENFYGTMPATREEVKEALLTCGNANLMGEEAVSVAIEIGLIEKGACMMIGTVPHAQIYRI
jgi:hypothetical protein